MKRKATKWLLFVLISVTTSDVIWGQEALVEVKQDSLISKALMLKIEANREQFSNEFYMIQLYYGTYDQATEIMEEVQELDPELEVKMSFETPNYKVQVGPFKKYLDALEQLNILKKTFREAFLLEPKTGL
jgi:hypothetical protein